MYLLFLSDFIKLLKAFFDWKPFNNSKLLCELFSEKCLQNINTFTMDTIFHKRSFENNA